MASQIILFTFFWLVPPAYFKSVRRFTLDNSVRRVVRFAAAIAAVCVPVLAGTPVTAPTPEPGTFVLLGAGAGALVLFARKRRK